MDERERKKIEADLRREEKEREIMEKKRKQEMAREKGLLEVYDKISEKKRRKK